MTRPDLDPARAVVEIVAVAAELDRRTLAALTTMRAYRRGYATGHSGQGDPSSRTEALALTGPDQVDRDLRLFADALARAMTSLHTAYNVAARYPPAHKPTLIDKNAAEGSDPDDGYWCVNHRHHGMIEPRSERYATLCRQCGDYRRAQSMLPTRQLLEGRARGERITRRKLRQYTGRAS